MMDFNGKLVAFGLSIWHYGFALDDCVKMDWEGIQFIGKGLRDQRSRWLERWRLKEGSNCMRGEHMDCASLQPIRE